MYFYLHLEYRYFKKSSHFHMKLHYKDFICTQNIIQNIPHCCSLLAKYKENCVDMCKFVFAILKFKSLLSI